jgi:hypothetical protein
MSSTSTGSHFVGTAIGTLFATAEIASGLGALFAGRVMALGNPLLRGTILSILLIAATPLLGGLFGLLLLFQVARGWLEGVIQPVVLSVQARAVGSHQQGAVVGRRGSGLARSSSGPSSARSPTALGPAKAS